MPPEPGDEAWREIQSNDGGDFYRGDDGAFVLYLLPDLAPAVKVFGRCTLAMVGGMGTQCLGIAATEIQAALVLCAVPAEQWPEVSEDVAAMGQVVSSALNARMARAAKG